MPAIRSEHLCVAFDMHGCPNRCRHCYLGCGNGQRMPGEDVRWGVQQFRSYLSSDENEAAIRTLGVATWFREPDYADNYRELYDLEAELSDCKPYRYELLSIWRLARDADYARWAREVGPGTCQITFFGMEQTSDWFYRRKGAFRDALTATERLLDAGLKPRWQIFLTKKLIPEIGDLLGLVDRLRLRERVAALGGEFTIFLHTPGPDGNAREIEHLRPTEEEVRSLPAEIIESSKKHHSKRERLWRPERELLCEILSKDDAFPYGYLHPEQLWLLVKSDWDVCSNLGTLEDWWRLGNLWSDSVAELLGRFENDAAPALRTIYHHSPRDLARRFGDPQGSKVYTNADDLLSQYVAAHCEGRDRPHYSNTSSPQPAGSP